MMIQIWHKLYHIPRHFSLYFSFRESERAKNMKKVFQKESVEWYYYWIVAEENIKIYISEMAESDQNQSKYSFLVSV